MPDQWNRDEKEPMPGGADDQVRGVAEDEDEFDDADAEDLDDDEEEEEGSTF